MTSMTETLVGGRRVNATNPRAASSIPPLSVVTVVRNGETTLDACIQSVSAQTYPNVHHVIVDGASTDGTVDILRRRDAALEYWVTEPDKGIYNALNKAIALIRSSHYVVLGCDDLLMPSAAEDLMRHANDALIVSGMVKFDSPRGGEMHIRNHSGGTMISVEAHRLLGPYDETYRIAADTKFLTSARLAGITKDIDDIVGVFVAGGASASYSNNVREHARAMHEAGAWGPLRSLAWKAPRLALAALRR